MYDAGTVNLSGRSTHGRLSFEVLLVRTRRSWRRRAGIVNLIVRWAEGRRFFSEVRSGHSACLGDLAPNPEGALARSTAAVGSDGFGIGNVKEVRHLIVSR